MWRVGAYWGAGFWIGALFVSCAASGRFHDAGLVVSCDLPFLVYAASLSLRSSPACGPSHVGVYRIYAEVVCWNACYLK